MRTWPHPIVFGLLLVIACGGTLPWKMPGAPQVPPDEQFRTGHHAGEHVYVWHCHKGSRVMITQSGSCFGVREPEVERGACGAPLPGEKRFDDYDRDAGEKPSESFLWPTALDGGPPP